ncbi:lauroyl/myristoyl acyltransferase [Paenibacillus sp. DS2363]|uniref:LpxL/LpxP family acyltransferase n=1 Tax=unclassified Paenibacillus TaxID=185978 RepID=UPI0030FC364B
MMNFRSLYDMHREQVRDELHKERQDGIHLGSFYALMNIIKEMAPLKPKQSAESIWMDYLAFLRTINEHKKSPYSFMEWDEVEGREHLQATLREGGALLTWHYGFVRHNMITIGQEIRAGHMSAKLPFYLIAEQETVEQEKKLSGWEAIRKYAGAELLNAEDEMIGIRLYSHLRKGGSFSLFVDGQTGFNTDNHAVELPFLSSKIRTRSGIFRILAKTQKPVCVYFMTLTEDFRSKIVFLPPVVLDQDIQASADRIYEPFREQLLSQPALWRFWDRHHQQVIHWRDDETSITDEAVSRVDWISKPLDGFGQLGLNTDSGAIYNISS